MTYSIRTSKNESEKHSREIVMLETMMAQVIDLLNAPVEAPARPGLEGRLEALLLKLQLEKKIL